MKIGILKKELNKWQMGIEINRRFEIRMFWPFIRIWCMRLNLYPEPGAVFTKRRDGYSVDAYRGFYLYWSPRIPIITMRTFRIGHKYFSIPIKFN